MKSLKRHWRSVAAWVGSHRLASAALALAVILVLYFSLFSGGQAAAETITVQPGDFTASVSVAGNVVAAQDVDLGFAKGGRVAAVYVRAGQQVSRGQTLASVENADARAALAQRQAALTSARAHYALVSGSTRTQEISLAQADVESAQEGLVTTLRDAYRAADNAVRNATGELFDSPYNLGDFRFAASNSRYNEPATRERKELEHTLVAWQESQIPLSAGSDLAFATALAKTNLAAVAQFLSDTNRALADSEPEQGYVTQAQLSAYISDVAAARAAIGAMQASVNTDAAGLITAQKNLGVKQASTPEDVAVEAANVVAAQADVAAAQAEVAKTLIVAPFAGTVSKVDAKVGAALGANEPVIFMLGNGNFQVEAFIPEINISTVHIGDKATTTLDAYGPDINFPATVVSIDPAETIKGGVSNYKTTLQFDTQDVRIRSGLTANVVIVTQHKSGVIAIPQGAVVLKGAQRVVNVMEGKKVVERPVTLGLSSMIGNVEVTSGLSAGDVVVLGAGN
jgi:HlyD family secretion protein